MPQTRPPARPWKLRVLVFLVLFAAALGLPAADALNWHVEKDRVDAQIKDWELPTLLQQIATATGWQIYVEPNAKHSTTAQFLNLPPGEALHRLLGSLNYALLPQTNAPAKLFVFRTSLSDATQLVRGKNKFRSAKAIPNELIVTLKPGAGESIEDLAKRLGAKITGRIDGLNTYRLQFQNEAAAQAARDSLSNNGDLTMVGYNYPVDPPILPQNLAFSSAPSFSLKPGSVSDGSGIIGLIDTSVQPAASGFKDFLLPALSVAGEASPSDTLPTHGTSMLETILRGLAQLPSPTDGTPVRILPVDVYGNAATTSTYDVAKGIYEAINGGAQIINLSLGSPGDSQFLHNIIKQGYDQGVLFVAAAGNVSTDAPTYPAAYTEVLAVTAGDRQGNIASYANYGSFVDAVGPSSTIVYFNGKAYFVTGTSASTAYISGLAAALANSTGKKPTEIVPQIIAVYGVKPTAK